jgi:uncharacterized coiled-coil protein SlyX
MKKKWSAFIIVILLGLILSSCGQEKVIDTDFVRLQNKVKDLEATQQQKSDELSALNQSMTEMQKTLSEQNDQLNVLETRIGGGDAEQKHPVVIQDVHITSKNKDASGQIWGPFDLQITLYNASTKMISDKLVITLITDSGSLQGVEDVPVIQNLIQKYEISPKESKLITVSAIPAGNPTHRLNIVVKLLEESSIPLTPENAIAGKVTWTIVPTFIAPPK